MTMEEIKDPAFDDTDDIIKLISFQYLIQAEKYSLGLIR